jgi:hypothetical protein
MDADRFDTLTRTLTPASRSRRVTLSGLSAGVLVVLGLTLEQSTVRGKKKGKRKECPKAKPKRCGDKCCKPSERCKKGKCVNHCNDGVKNFGETGIDCGGTCVEDRRFLLGTCAVGQGCQVDTDCTTGICVNLTCVVCRESSDCARASTNTAACINNECFECARDADCPRPGQPPEEDKCVEPINARCPAGKPCVCRQCRISAECPQDQFCDETGTCTGGCLAEGATCTIFQDGSDACCDTPEELSCLGGQCVS